MEISNLDMETKPSCNCFHYISASKNITIANFDSSNSNDNADDPTHKYTAFFKTQSSFYIPRLNVLNKIKQRFNPTNLPKSFINKNFSERSLVN